MSPFNLPDSASTRAHFDSEGAQSMKLMGLSGSTVEPWEDGYRTHAQADQAFEWWYFDMQLDDGSTLVATFNTKPATDPASPTAPSMLLIHRGADQPGIKEELPAASGAFRASTDGCDVAIGDSTVTGDLARYTLHLAGTRIQADLVLDRGAPSWRPGAGVTWFDHAKKHFLAWVVPVPYGTVQGTITVDGAARQVTGTGYHDHNWGNRQMNAGLDHWFWGRAHIAGYTVVYAMLTTKGLFGMGQINLPTVMLATSDRLLTDDLLPLRLVTSGEVPGPGPDKQPYPTRLEWTWQHGDEHFSMTVTNPTVIESLDMAPKHPSRVHQALHPHEHPWYYDFTADMQLRIHLGGVDDTVTGQTLYEKMMFS